MSGKKIPQLFFSMLYISTFTFGGGFVIITLMKQKFVDKLHWIDEQEMLDLAALSQSSPGDYKTCNDICKMLLFYGNHIDFGINSETEIGYDVDKLHWIDEQEMLDLAALSQSSPGAIAVNEAPYHVKDYGSNPGLHSL